MLWVLAGRARVLPHVAGAPSLLDTRRGLEDRQAGVGVISADSAGT